MSEYRNLYKGNGIMIALMLLVILTLSRVAYFTGAGTAAFQMSLLFILGQTVVEIVVYTMWYRKVNHLAADMYNTGEKRRMAFGYLTKYLVIAILLTGAIAAVAVVAILLNILFVGISPVYCYSSVLTMLFVGNIALFVLMRCLGLPNRVTNTY